MRGGGAVYFDSGHIPTVDEWHEHEKPTIYGVSRKQLAVFAGAPPFSLSLSLTHTSLLSLALTTRHDTTNDR
jgi:hypothetical protein